MKPAAVKKKKSSYMFQILYMQIEKQVVTYLVHLFYVQSHTKVPKITLQKTNDIP